MYIPAHFRETDLDRIAELIERNAFGMLVTAPDGSPFVSHLPFIFERSAADNGKLFCHMARANPQWQHCSSGGNVLAVFQGPHAYVSPSWYASEGVPTWNYAVVHLRGKARLIESEPELWALVERLTHIYEDNRSSPWRPDPAADGHRKMLKAIVGLEIQVTDIEAKFKLSQNRSLQDRQNVIQALAQSVKQMEVDLANLM